MSNGFKEYSHGCKHVKHYDLWFKSIFSHSTTSIGEAESNPTISHCTKFKLAVLNITARAGIEITATVE